jgi:hypothetical protein
LGALASHRLVLKGETMSLVTLLVILGIVCALVYIVRR